MGFVSTDIGREIVALQNKPARGLVLGEKYLIIIISSANDATHNGTCDPSNGCLGANILFSHLGTQWGFANATTTQAPTTQAPVVTTQAPTTQAPTTQAPVVTTQAPTLAQTSSLTTLADYVEIRDNLLSALKELTKVTINQYSVQDRQVIHERRSEIRKELKSYDRKIALLEGSAKGFKSPSLESFRAYDSI